MRRVSRVSLLHVRSLSNKKILVDSNMGQDASTIEELPRFDLKILDTTKVVSTSYS